MAIIILYFSFVRAGLEKTLNDEKSDSLRKISISYFDSKGEEKCYRLPKSGVLPNNIFYPIKEFRDELWVYLSRNKIDKLTMMLLINDKRIGELLSLNDDNKRLIDNHINRTKEMRKKIMNIYNEITENNPEIKIIKSKVETANEFYEFIYEKFYQDSIIDRCYE